MMEKLNELEMLAQAIMDAETSKEAFDIGEKFTLACSPENILSIAEAFRAIEQRAEAAEAKLAELVPPKMVATADMVLNDIIEASIDGWNDCRDAILRNIEGSK